MIEVIPTEFEGLKIIVPRVFEDSRGYFFESYNHDIFKRAVGEFNFVQDNQSLSKAGVLRGLHFQLAPKAQTKLVRVLSGSVWDVVVDLRPGSKTYKKSYGIELSAENNKQLLIPKGFAHGFCVLGESAIFQYKVDELYSRDHDRGIRFDDPELAIEWPNVDRLILSDKDRSLPCLKDVEGLR